MHDTKCSRYKIPMTYARYIAAAMVVLIAASCATYRLGPDPARADGKKVDRPARVAVETVATPAEWAMDAGRLTRTLVDDLAGRGITAEWTDGADISTVVHCSADGPPPKAFRANHIARVDVRCRVASPADERTVVTTRGAAAAGAPTGAATSLGDAASRAMHEATAEALARAVPRIADALSRQPSSNSDD
ncbi:MAG: hypothetical protein ABEN55_04430 [Bradymonadaceae bacterium]